MPWNRSHWIFVLNTEAGRRGRHCQPANGRDEGKLRITHRFNLESGVRACISADSTLHRTYRNGWMDRSMVELERHHHSQITPTDRKGFFFSVRPHRKGDVVWGRECSGGVKQPGSWMPSGGGEKESRRHACPRQEVPANRGGLFCMGAQTCIDILLHLF